MNLKNYIFAYCIYRSVNKRWCFLCKIIPMILQYSVFEFINNSLDFTQFVKRFSVTCIEWNSNKFDQLSNFSEWFILMYIFNFCNSLLKQETFIFNKYVWQHDLNGLCYFYAINQIKIRSVFSTMVAEHTKIRIICRDCAIRDSFAFSCLIWLSNPEILFWR